jgi:histidinol-phosphate aminotransferase
MKRKNFDIQPSKAIQKYLSSMDTPLYLDEQNQGSSNFIYLDKNENPFLPPLEDLSSLISLEVLKNYPDPNSNEILNRLSLILEVPTSYLIAGSGSDELLDLVIRTFATSKTTVLSISPTFSMYKFYTSINNAKYVTVPLELSVNEASGLAKFNLDQEIFIKKAKMSDIIILARPNNPDGMTIDIEFIEKLLELEKLIIIDEAYIDFSYKPSLIGLTKNCQNLIISRSFSKSFSLAGLRLGYIIANPSIRKILMKVKSPFNVNNMALKIGSILLNNYDKVSANINKIKQIREEFYSDLIKLRENCKGFYIHPSEANFILLRFQSQEKSQSVYQFFLKNQIKVRKFDAELSNCLRISIGTSLQMKKVMKILNLCFKVN